MGENEHIKNQSKWLPISSEELNERSWDIPDIIIVSGDAYVDHPSFGHAVIARVLEHEGFRVAILPQPNWRDDLRDFKKLGKPRLFFGITSGCMDSMVNHYTANRRRRSDDAYTPGGKAGFRPDYAVSVYSQILKRLYPDTPIIIGGVEASLRRFTHYDYWSDGLRPSILEESGADILVYGMGEKAIRTIAKGLAEGKLLEELHSIPQTAYLVKDKKDIPSVSRPDINLKSHTACELDKRNYATNFALVEKASNRMETGRILQEGKASTVVVNPPFPSLEEAELDAVYSLPFTRMPHPRYSKRGSIPAWEMIRNSITIHRGCFGGCAFCTISAHQGKFVQSRSESSILKELENVINTPGFNGVISDLGGRSANMYKMQGHEIEQCLKCSRASCLYPQTCSNLDTNHLPLLELYRKAQKVQGVKHLFIGSGIRYDLFMSTEGVIGKGKGHEAYVKQLVQQHVSGRLKVAPEHCSPNVLSIMRKPSFEMYKRFKVRFDTLSAQAGKKQQLIPYFISSHPGSKVEDMALLAIEAKQMGYLPEQTQDFTPTPMTLATVMYYTGLNPYTLKPVFVPKGDKDKRIQQKILYWYKKENVEDVRHYLLSAKRSDLVEKLYGRKGK